MTGLVRMAVLGGLLLGSMTGVFAQSTDPDAEYGKGADNLVVLSERLRVTERYIFFAQQKVLDARGSMIELLYEGQPSSMTTIWMEVITSASDEIAFCEEDLKATVKPALRKIAGKLDNSMYQNAVAGQEKAVEALIESLHKGCTQVRATTLRLYQFISGDNINGVIEQLQQLRTICFGLDHAREQLNTLQNELRKLAGQLREISAGH